MHVLMHYFCQKRNLTTISIFDLNMRLCFWSFFSIYHMNGHKNNITNSYLCMLKAVLKSSFLNSLIITII